LRVRPIIDHQLFVACSFVSRSLFVLRSTTQCFRSEDPVSERLRDRARKTAPHTLRFFQKEEIHPMSDFDLITTMENIARSRLLFFLLKKCLDLTCWDFRLTLMPSTHLDRGNAPFGPARLEGHIVCESNRRYREGGSEDGPDQ
jgi:hypothetical protein